MGEEMNIQYPQDLDENGIAWGVYFWFSGLPNSVYFRGEKYTKEFSSWLIK
jgi:hypothetical protein